MRSLGLEQLIVLLFLLGKNFGTNVFGSLDHGLELIDGFLPASGLETAIGIDHQVFVGDTGFQEHADLVLNK